jgi:hypothetical protein
MEKVKQTIESIDLNQLGISEWDLRILGPELDFARFHLETFNGGKWGVSVCSVPRPSSAFSNVSRCQPDKNRCRIDAKQMAEDLINGKVLQLGAVESLVF